MVSKCFKVKAALLGFVFGSLAVFGGEAFGQDCYDFTGQTANCFPHGAPSEVYCTGTCVTLPGTGFVVCPPINGVQHPGVQREDINTTSTWDGFTSGTDYEASTGYEVVCYLLGQCQCKNVGGTVKCVVDLSRSGPVTEDVVELDTGLPCPEEEEY